MTPTAERTIIYSLAEGAKFRTISDRATDKNSDVQTVEKARRTNYKPHDSLPP
jgi:hypothetical protein